MSQRVVMMSRSKKGQSHDVICAHHQTAASERTLIRLLNTISICPRMRRSRSDMPLSSLSSSHCDCDITGEGVVRVANDSDDVI